MKRPDPVCKLAGVYCRGSTEPVADYSPNSYECNTFVFSSVNLLSEFTIITGDGHRRMRDSRLVYWGWEIDWDTVSTSHPPSIFLTYFRTFVANYCRIARRLVKWDCSRTCASSC